MKDNKFDKWKTVVSRFSIKSLYFEFVIQSYRSVNSQMSLLVDFFAFSDVLRFFDRVGQFLSEGFRQRRRQKSRNKCEWSKHEERQEGVIAF